mmetsp:Transcript_91369/g.293447  ORF Transcript_91369/g.293447 Transcript_91369/m.293447 type:complete len:735 (-) Transcript_91369:134-2338(-)
MWCIWIVALHRIPKKVFLRTLCSFDGFALVLNGTIYNGAKCFNRLSAGFATGVMTPSWAIYQVASSTLVYIPLVLFCANIDALLASRCLKSVVLSFALLCYVYEYWDVRYTSQEWEPREVCIGLCCVYTRSIILQCNSNIVIFLAKMVAAYAVGYDMAVLVTPYRRTHRSRKCCTTSFAARVPHKLDSDGARELAVSCEACSQTFDVVDRASLNSGCSQEALDVEVAVRGMRSAERETSEGLVLTLEWDGDVSADPFLQRLSEDLDDIVREVTHVLPQMLGATIMKVSVTRRPRGVSGRDTQSKGTQASPQSFRHASSTDQIRGDPQTSDEFTCRGLVAFEAIKVIPTRYVLQSSIVRWLVRHRLYHVVVALTTLAFTVASFTGEADVPVVLDSGDSMVIRRLPLHDTLLELTTLWFGFALILHRTPRGLLRMTFCSFDSLAILINAILQNSAGCWNRLSLGFEAGVMTPIWAVSQILSTTLVYVPTVMLFANFDAYLGPVWIKLVVVVVVFSCYTYSLLVVCLVSKEWGSRQVCFWWYCTEARGIAVVSMFNIIIFLGKMLVSYASGHDMATLVTSYRYTPAPHSAGPSCLKRLCTCIMRRVRRVGDRISAHALQRQEPPHNAEATTGTPGVSESPVTTDFVGGQGARAQLGEHALDVGSAADMRTQLHDVHSAEARVADTESGSGQAAAQALDDQACRSLGAVVTMGGATLIGKPSQDVTMFAEIGLPEEFN